ncbi:MAG: hypothetical protein ACTTJ4_05425 [Treponema sp.]|uniref:hypothetical protein n=1 Tax=Treponema sp. TaxID=166 RepID=UPI003FA1B366
MNRPSTAITQDVSLKDSTPDEFGFDFLLVGQVYDESAVPMLKITAEGNGQKREKTLNNIPQNIRITVDSFGNSTDNPFYKPLYNGEENGGTKKYEYGITVTDSAKEYNNPGDFGAGTGNTTDRYYLFDDLYKPVLSAYKIQEVYAMLRGIYTSGGGGGRGGASAVDPKTAEDVRKILAAAQLGGEGSKKGTFALNPSRNPRFAIAGDKPVARDELEANPPTAVLPTLYLDDTLKVQLSCNLDGVPLNAPEKYNFFLMTLADFSAYTGGLAYPSEEKINSADFPPANAIRIQNSNISWAKQGSNYLVTLKIDTELGLSIPNKYILLVQGTDQNEKYPLIPDLKGVDKGVYGFTLAKTVTNRRYM